VVYNFSSPSYVATITTAQRLEFAVSNSTVPDSPTGHNNSVIFHDCDTVDITNFKCLGSIKNPLAPNVVPLDTNPLNKEALAVAIFAGTAGDWDNYHQTYNPRISEPRFSLSRIATEETLDVNKLIIPGCPECVHMHWRWSDAISGSVWGGGQPLIPPGSKQSVDIAVVEAGLSNDDANVLAPRFAQVSPGPLPSVYSLTNPVLWYGASSSAQSDTFFYNGAWYSSGFVR
jgi:hypothetical protein